MSEKKQKSIISFWAPKGQPPKKVARSEEETVEEVEAETVEKIVRVTVGEKVEETIEKTVDKTGKKKKALSGAATRCTLKSEWSTKWPFITIGTSSSYNWCSVCRQENSGEQAYKT